MDAEEKLAKIREIVSLWNWGQYFGHSDDALEDILDVVGDWRQENVVPSRSSEPVEPDEK